MATYRYTSYALFAASLLMASCSQEETIGANSGNAGKIEFRASLPLVATRATETKGSTLRDFHVSGFTTGETSETPYFLDKEFSKNDATGRYVSTDGTCIWPNNNDILRFLAISPSCSEMRTKGGFTDTDFSFTHSAGHKLSNFRIAHDIASQTDFITAMATGQLLENEETGVVLNFKHQLSRIGIKAWGDSKSFDLEIAGVP